MPHRLHPTLPTLTLALLTLCLFLAGCGTQEYEKTYAQSIDHYRKETPFRALFEKPVANFPCQCLSLRLPLIFAKDKAQALDLDPLTLDPRDPKAALQHPEHRVYPEFLSLLKMQGLQRTYEGFTQIESKTGGTIERPYYLYVAAVSTRDPKGGVHSDKELAEQLRKQLVKKFGERVEKNEKGAKIEKGVTPWETVDLLTPAGTRLSWQRLKASGEQEFIAYSDKRADVMQAEEGVLLLYLYSTSDLHVILGWRARDKFLKTTPLEKIAEACAGTVKVGSADAAPSTGK